MIGPEVWAGFVVGLLSGGLLQALRYRFSRRMELREKVAQPLDHVFPILEGLHRNVTFLLDTLSSNSTEHSGSEGVQEHIKNNLESFKDWYTEFGSSILLELRHQDRELLARIQGLLLYANASSQSESIIGQLEPMEAALARALAAINRFRRRF